MERITVLLADDHPILRQGARSLLEDDPQIEILGEAADGAEAVELAVCLHPNIVIMDINMPGLDGLQATRMIREQAPHVRVIVFSMYCGTEDIEQAIQAGVQGFIAKQGDTQDILAAVREVHKGHAYFSPLIAKTLLLRHQSLIEIAPSALTLREKDILRMIAQGMTSKDIARHLGVNAKRVDKFRQRIMRKLGIHTSTGLTRYAVEKGLVR